MKNLKATKEINKIFKKLWKDEDKGAFGYNKMTREEMWKDVEIRRKKNISIIYWERGETENPIT